MPLMTLASMRLGGAQFGATLQLWSGLRYQRFTFSAHCDCTRSLHRSFSGRADPLHDHALKPVLLLCSAAIIIAYTDRKSRLFAQLFESFLPHRNREHTEDVALAIRGLITMLAGVPTEKANLVVVERQAIPRLS